MRTDHQNAKSRHGGSGIPRLEASLVTPLAAGVRTSVWQLEPTSEADVSAVELPGPFRQPIVLARLKRGLADAAVGVTTFVGTSTSGTSEPLTVFAPFTEADTELLIYRPDVAFGTDGTGDITLRIQLQLVVGEERNWSRPSDGFALSSNEAAELVEVTVLEGQLARVVYLSTLEKQRCIRQARELAAIKSLDLAHGAALDHTGLDLGVPRTTADPSPESDLRYRARLRLFKPWRLPTPAGFAETLNGQGPAVSANDGPISAFGVTDRFKIVEETNDMAVATKLIAVGEQGPQLWDRFDELARSTLLFDLDEVAPNNLAASRRAELERVRLILTDSIDRTTGTDRPRYMTRLTASSLARTIEVMAALGHTDRLSVTRAYDRKGGSRYELGSGLDIKNPSPAALRSMIRELPAAAERIGPLAALLQSLEPRDPDVDPLARWLFEPCGFRTVQSIDEGAAHLSTVLTLGQSLEGPSVLAVDASAEYLSQLRGSVDRGQRHVRVDESLDELSQRITDAGLNPLVPLDQRDLFAHLEDVVEVGNTDLPPELDEASAAGLISVDARSLAQSVLSMNPDQLAGFVVAGGDLDDLGTEDEAREALVGRYDLTLSSGFHSVHALWDGSQNHLLVLASISQLPGATARFGQPPVASYYWYRTDVADPNQATNDRPSLIGLAGTKGIDPSHIELVQRRGGKAMVRGRSEGLALLVCVSYSRSGLADPFEVRIELDNPDTVLSMDQYGFMMNMLEGIAPIGIEINTFDIRRNHVDEDGDGVPEWLTSRASRTYQRYRTNRFRSTLGDRNGHNRR